MRPADWLLLLIAARGERAIDPVRVQKGMFLLAMSGELPAEERYVFVPYSYGPMSRQIYRDVRALERAGEIVRVSVRGHGWQSLRATTAGLARAGSLVAPAIVGEVRTTVDGKSFAELLEYIYARHPEFATRSVFRRP